MRWVSLEPRQAGIVLSDLEYRTINNGGRTIFTVSFRHWDQRIWQASIEQRTTPIVVEDVSFHFSLTLTSSSCRTFHFLSRTKRSAVRTVSRFANISDAIYERLTADARGTTDHPRSQTIGVFSMVTARHEKTYHGTVTSRSELSGIGRVDGPNLIIFPTTAELSRLLRDIAHVDTSVVIAEGINQVNMSTSAAPRMFHAIGSDNYENPPTLTLEQADALINRAFNDTSDDAFAGLIGGSSKLITARREDRVIDLGLDDAEENDEAQ